MPKLYQTKYCVCCGMSQYIYKIQLLCDDCIYMRKHFGYIPYTDGYFFNYHTGKLEDFIVRFN